MKKKPDIILCVETNEIGLPRLILCSRLCCKKHNCVLKQGKTHLIEYCKSYLQILEFRVFNISHGSQPLRGRLPLTPGSTLTWFGFSEEGQLSSFDSKVHIFQSRSNCLQLWVLCMLLLELLYSQGILRVFTSQFGGTWLPLFRYYSYNSFLHVFS